MSLTSVTSIALSGMNAATTRLEASASNVANVMSTGSVPDASGKSSAYTPVDVSQTAMPGGGVAASLTSRNPAFELQSAPDSPEADSRGLVAAPNVSLEGEVSNQLMARISYEASAKVMKVANEMQKVAGEALS